MLAAGDLQSCVDMLKGRPKVTRGSADILNALQGTPGASRALYGAIFGRGAVRRHLDQAQHGRGRAGLARKKTWEVPRRIPAAQQPLVRALGQLLGGTLHLLRSQKDQSRLSACFL